MPTNGGLVNPAAEIGAVAREAGVLYLLDACQSVGQLPVDVEAIGCDVLSATGRKFLRGPRGTGFLYVRRELLDRLEPPFLDLHAATVDRRATATSCAPTPRRFENWESYVAGKLGLGARPSTTPCDVGPRRDPRPRRAARRPAARAAWPRSPGVDVHDRGRERCGIVTFTVAGRCRRDESRRRLGARARSTSRCRRASDAARHGGRARCREVVRASVHYYNTEDEVSRVAGAVSRLAAAARGAR